MPERRRAPRKKFNVYMRVLNDDTQEILGHMVELSATGLQLETTVPIPIQTDYYMRLELTADVANKPYIVFIGRSKWCKMDEIEPNLFHVGFQLVEIMPEDKEIFLRILVKYGK
jgi:hypothetical protein